MKFFSGLLICMFISSFCLAQIAVVSNDRNNTLFAGIDNQLSIAVENTSNKSIVLKASRGTITRIEDGKYSCYVSEYGLVDIIIFRNHNGKLKEVRKIPFRVDSLPDPVAFVVGVHAGSIRKKLQFPQGGIIAKFVDAEIDAPIRVDSYTVFIIYNDSCKTKTISNRGNRFNAEVVQAFQGLRNKDTVVIKDIYVILPNGKRRQILPLFFAIEE